MEIASNLSVRLRNLMVEPATFSGLPARLPLAQSRVSVSLLEATIEGRPGLLMWDSGADGTVLDRQFCSELQLETVGPLRLAFKDVSGREGEGIEAGLLDHGIALGPVRVSIPAVACVDLSHVRALEPRLVGFLGANVLGATPYDLDRSTRSVTLGATRPSILQSLQARFSAGLPYVIAELDGKRSEFILDTGAELNVISREQVAELGAIPQAIGSKAPRYATPLSDTQGPTGSITFQQFRSGMEDRQDIRFWVGGENVLGLDFIGPRRLFVDQGAGVIAFVPPNPELK